MSPCREYFALRASSTASFLQTYDEGGITTMKRAIHACIWCLALSVAAALPAWAAPSSPPTYDYTLNLPELQPTDEGYQETGSTFQLEFSWIGPMQTDSSGPSSVVRRN